jgi:hypothetical protein
MAMLYEALNGLGFVDEISAHSDNGEYVQETPGLPFGRLYVSGAFTLPTAWGDAVTYVQANDDDAVDGGELPTDWMEFETARAFVTWYEATYYPNGEG